MHLPYNAHPHGDVTSTTCLECKGRGYVDMKDANLIARPACASVIQVFSFLATSRGWQSNELKHRRRTPEKFFQMLTHKQESPSGTSWGHLWWTGSTLCWILSPRWLRIMFWLQQPNWCQGSNSRAKSFSMQFRFFWGLWPQGCIQRNRMFTKYWISNVIHY